MANELRRSALLELRELLREVLATEVLEPLSEPLDRLEVLERQMAELRETASPLRSVADRLLEGKLKTFSDGLVELAAATSMDQPLSTTMSRRRGGALIDEARRAATRSMNEVVRQLGVKWLEEYIEPRIRACNEERAALNQQLRGISSIEQAIQSKNSTKAAEAWMRSTDLGKVWVVLDKARRRLVSVLEELGVTLPRSITDQLPRHQRAS